MSKRQYMGQDLLDARFGRFFEVLAGMSRMGHGVRGITLSYRLRTEGLYRWHDLPGLAWQSVNLRMLRGLIGYRKLIHQTVTEFRTHVVCVCSDAFHAIATRRLFGDRGVSYVIDLYDNFESYAATRTPGLIPHMRVACHSAYALTVISHPLAG